MSVSLLQISAAAGGVPANEPEPTGSEEADANAELSADAAETEQEEEVGIVNRDNAVENAATATLK